MSTEELAARPASQAAFKRWRRKQVWVSDIDESVLPPTVRKRHQRQHQHQEWDRRLLQKAKGRRRKRRLRRHIAQHQLVIDRIHARYPATPSAAPSQFPSQPDAPVATHAFFQHGTATGDPLPDRVVIWTRLTPVPSATPGSGVGPPTEVRWQVADDRGFARVVAQGTASTSAAADNTVKLDATGLAPATDYYVRFAWQGPWRDWQFSPTARTRTAPAADSFPDNVRFGVVSCANLQAGWFTPYRALAARDDLSAVLHLGDYLYEYGPGEYGYGPGNVDVRPHDPPHEMVALDDYRRRHAQYKQDPDLAALHQRHPFITIWDDHETVNDAWSAGAENHHPGEGEWSVRAAAAKQAYDEWMPIRLRGAGKTLYRRLTFGNLAELTLLDLRSYRDEQVGLGSPESESRERTITGADQMAYLKDSLSPDAPQWRLVGNPVMISPVRIGNLPQDLIDALGELGGGTALPSGVPYNVDQWDGYTADRRELLDHIADHGVRDVVFLTGDIHSAWSCDVPYDPSLYLLELGGSAGVEFVCTSVSSNNLKDIVPDPTGAASTLVETTLKALNPHIRYLDFDSHGFSVLDITPARAQMDWFVISDRADEQAVVRWATSWQTRTGTGRVTSVKGPVA